MEITIYSTPTCPHCVLAKEYLKQNKIDFQELDVSQDQKSAEEMIQKTGQTGVPVLIVKFDDGREEIIPGFDKKRIDQIILKK